MRSPRYAGETSALASPTSADHADEQPAGGVDDEPVADERVAGSASATAASDERERAGRRARRPIATPVTSAPRRERDERDRERSGAASDGERRAARG